MRTALLVVMLALGLLASGAPIAAPAMACPPDDQAPGCEPNPVGDLVCEVLDHTRYLACIPHP